MPSTFTDKEARDFRDLADALLLLDALAAEEEPMSWALAAAGLDPRTVESVAHGVTEVVMKRASEKDEDINHTYLLVLGICVGLYVGGVIG